MTGGLGGGLTKPLAPGRWIVGRDRACDVAIAAPTVSSVHLELSVDALGGITATDLQSHNGTRHRDEFLTAPTAVLGRSRLRLGAIDLTVGATDPRPGRPPGPVTFNRPPRPAPPRGPDPVRVPEEPAPPPARSRLAIAALAVPLAMGAVMAAMWGARMALFALFTPVLVLGSWLEERRRSAHDGRQSAAQARRDLERFEAELGRAADEHQRWLESVVPDVAEVASRALGPATSLWQRRPGHDDWMRLRLATGRVPWEPPLSQPARPSASASAVLARHQSVDDAPMILNLSPGHVLGLVGARDAVESLLRSLLVQVATHHGPADVRIAVLTDTERADGWGWAKWLPHTEAGGEAAGLRLLAATESETATVVGALSAMAPTRTRDGEPAGPTPERMLVVDADGLTEGRPAPVRAMLTGSTGPVSGIVVAAHPSRLPACCTTIAVVDEDGVVRVVEPATGSKVDGLLAAGMSPAVAAETARALAGIDDPEVAEAGAGLPDHVALLSLLGVEPNEADITERWHGGGDLRTPIGMTADGPLVIDLVAAGPHALIGGTTGAGKSELLRSLVVGLAASASPDDLTFVLVDYKGGSAFDACARLPHTVGLVTDLDEHLGRRALRCLEAELRHRETVLRTAGATDLTHLRRVDTGPTLPRLVVVIDEFATMAAELPDFIDALVGIAQRGRSLGVHLVLATQRPAGAVNDNIRANTNLRVALRMQDTADSNDVVDSPVAAAVGRRQAGRGYVRLGPGEVVAFQTALVSHATRVASGNHRAVGARPLRFGPERPAPVTASDGPSDLVRLVDAIGRAHRRLGLAPPRRPWTDPLPADLDLADLPLGPGVVVGLADDPAGQRHVAFGWDRGAGCLLAYGLPGSGPSLLLTTLVTALAHTHGPDGLHVYAFDFGPGDLRRLVALPHTGAVVGAGEPERQRRLLDHLRAELNRRRSSAVTGPDIVVVIDNWSAMAAAFDEEHPDVVLRDDVGRLVADGPSVGIWTVITADHAGAIPLGIANLVPSKLAFRLADIHDYRSLGLDGDLVPAAVPGRAVDVATGLEVQVATAATLAPLAGPRRAPAIGVLPAVVPIDDVVGWARPEGCSIGLGVSGGSLEVGGLAFGPGDHALITGPARSGRSTSLLVAATVAATSGLDVIGLAPRPASPLRNQPWCTDDLAAVHHRVAAGGPILVLVDDAEYLDDQTGLFVELLGGHAPDVHVVAAARNDGLRSAYGHWTRDLRRSRLGLALRPEVDDGDLLGSVFPRRPRPPDRPGCGYLVVDGRPEVFQVARP